MKFLNSKGFSLLELFTAMSIVALIAIYSLSFNSQTGNLYNEIETRFSGKIEGGFFFKNLNKQLENSYIIRDGLFKCEHGDSQVISSLSDPYTDRKVLLENIGDQLSFVYSSLSTIGGIPSSELNDYLEANLRLLFVNKQLELMTVQSKLGGSVSSSEKNNFEEQKLKLQGRLAQFHFTGNNLEISVINANEFNIDDYLLVSSIGNPKNAGLYRVTDTNSETQKISITYSGEDQLEHKCKIGNSMNIEDIIKNSVKDSAVFSSSLRLNVIHFVKYEINPHEKKGLKITYSEYSAKKTMSRDVLFNFKRFELNESWAPSLSFVSANGTESFLGAGDAKFLTRLEYISDGRKVSGTTAETSYTLSSAAKNNYGAATSPRSTYPVAPDGYALISTPFLAKICDDGNTFNQGFDDGGDCQFQQFYTEFFWVYGFVKAAPGDTSIRIATEGLQCWDPVQGTNYIVDSSGNLRLRNIGTSSTPNMTLYRGSDGSQSTICRMLRNSAGNFLATVPKDGNVELNFVLSYFDHNEGVLKNKMMTKLNELKLVNKQDYTIGTVGKCIKNIGIPSIVKPVLSAAPGAPIPLTYFGNDSCVWATGLPDNCGTQPISNNLMKVKFYPNGLNLPAGVNLEVTCN